MTNKELDKLNDLIFEAQRTYLNYSRTCMLHLDAQKLKEDGVNINLQCTTEAMLASSIEDDIAVGRLIDYVKELVESRENKNE